MWIVIVSGLASGGLYIAISLGVVLTFRFAHVLNFSQGAIATLCAYAAWQFMEDGWSIWLSWLAAIVIGAVISLGFGFFIGRYLADAPELLTTMATFGPALAIIGIVGELWGQSPKALSVPEVLSGTVSIRGATVGKFELAVLVAMLLLVGLISVLLRRTRTGLALRALADDPATAAVNGVGVAPLERLVWAVGGGIAGMAGVAISLSGQLDPNYLTSFLIVAFTAVVLGGIGTLSGLVVGCLAYGVVVALISYYVGSQYVAIASLVILALLYLIRPTGLLGHQTLVATNGLPTQSDSVATGRFVVALTKASDAVARLRPTGRRKRLGVGGLVAVVAVLLVTVLPMQLSGPFVFVLATMLAMLIAVLGQNAVSGMSGRLAIAQGGFMMLGGYCSALLAGEVGLSPIVALVAAVPLGAAVGAVLGLSTIRLSGIYLGIITLQFTLAVPELARSWTRLTGGEVGTILPPLEVGGRQIISTYDLWIGSAVVTSLALTLVAWFGYSRVGAKVRAVRDSEQGAESIGLDVPWLRIGAMAVSGAAGALAGSLSSFQAGIVTPESFGMWTSVTILLAAAIAGEDSLVFGPIAGASFVVLLPYALSTSGGWSSIIFGFSATVILILRRVMARARVLAAHGGPASRPAIAGTSHAPDISEAPSPRREAVVVTNERQNT